MDAPDWSKKFEVLSVSRLDLSAFGLTTEQINHLSDEDMQAIADKIGELVVIDVIVFPLKAERLSAPQACQDLQAFIQQFSASCDR